MKRLVIALGILAAFGTVIAADTGATVTDPTLAEQKIGATRPPPPPSPVTVMNWPAEQVVSGAVSVDNLPTVQSVNGTVSVGNLPLAEDGSVRVSSGPARQPVVYALLSEPVIVDGSVDLPTIIDTTGYQSIGLYAVSGGGGADVTALWRWSDDEEFARVYDQRGGGGYAGVLYSACRGWNGERFICANSGSSLKIRLNSNYGPATITSVRVYLFP